MDIKSLSKKQWKGIIGIVAVLAGITVVPPALQHFYGIDAVQTAFVIIVIYAIISWRMRASGKYKK